MADSQHRPPTPSQTVGPFFGIGLPFEGDAAAAGAGEEGSIRIEGQVFDGAGPAVSDVLLEAWSGDQFARCRTDAEGSYHFLLRRPAASAPSAPHFELTVFGRGLLQHLTTRIYLPAEAALFEADPVLQEVEEGRRPTLIAESDGSSLRFDVRLQGEGETVFFSR